MSIVVAVVACRGAQVAAQPAPQRCAQLKADAEQYESEKKYKLLNEALRRLAAECPTAEAFFEAGIALLRVDEAVDPNEAEGSTQKSDQRQLLAMNYLEEALRRKDPPLSAVNVAAAEMHVKRLQQRLALVRLVPADVRSKLSIELDGQELKLTSDRFWTTPGKHALVLTPKEAGLDPIVPDLPMLSRGQTHAVSVLLTRPEAPKVGGLRVMAEPASAVIEVDGAQPEVDEAGMIWLAPGEHRVRITAADHETREEVVRVQSGRSRLLQVELDRTGHPVKLGAFIVGGVGAAMLASGVVTGGLAVAAKNELKEACDGNVCPTNEESTADRADRLAISTDALIIAGAAALSAGVVWYFFFPREHSPSQASARIAPMVSPGLVGLAMDHRF